MNEEMLLTNPRHPSPSIQSVISQYYQLKMQMARQKVENRWILNHNSLFCLTTYATIGCVYMNYFSTCSRFRMFIEFGSSKPFWQIVKAILAVPKPSYTLKAV